MSAQVGTYPSLPDDSSYTSVLGAFTANTPASFWSIVPRMARADNTAGPVRLGATTRIGNRVEPVKITTELNFHYTDAECPLKQGFSYVMRYWVVTCKTAKNIVLANSLPVGKFLRQGDAPDTLFDWTTSQFGGPATPEQWIANSNKMVNHDLYTVHKTGELRIRKSAGNQGYPGSGDNYAPGTNSASIFQSKMVYSYKPPKLVYGEGSQDLYPDNHARFLLTVVYDETSGNISSVPPWIRYTINNQMWFKDA